MTASVTVLSFTTTRALLVSKCLREVGVSFQNTCKKKSVRIPSKCVCRVAAKRTPDARDVPICARKRRRERKDIRRHRGEMCQCGSIGISTKTRRAYETQSAIARTSPRPDIPCHFSFSTLALSFPRKRGIYAAPRICLFARGQPHLST